MFFSKNNLKYERLLIRIFFIIGIFLFKIILDRHYVVYGPLFQYLGFKYSPQSEFIQVFLYLLVLLSASILPLDHKKPSNIFLLLLYLMSYIPVVVIFSFDQMASVYGFGFYSLFILLLSMLDKVKFNLSNINTKNLSVRSFNWLLFILIGMGMVILISHYGFKLNVTSYEVIYDVRANFKELTQKSRLLAFSFGWMASVFTIVLLTISIIKKKWFFVFVAFLLQLYLFNLGGNKSIFMLPIFLLFIIFSLQFFKQFSVLFIVYAFVFMCFGLYFYDFVLNDKFSLASSIFVRRNFFVPANLYFYYIEFFEFQPADFFAKSFPFSEFLESNYDKNVPYIIGETYIRKGTHANGNFLADLYYNFKWVGFLIGFVVIFIYFRIMDRIVQSKNYLIIVPIAAVPVITLMNSGLIVNLVSFGLILIVILLVLFPNEKFYIKSKIKN
jgi:oligosaccharide repeat unit polymerase